MSHRSRHRIESPEEPPERVSVFERLGPKRISLQSSRNIEYANESDLRTRMTRKRPANDASPNRHSVSPVRHHSSSVKSAAKLDEKLDASSKVRSMVMAPNPPPESPTSSRRGRHSVQIDDDTDCEALVQKRNELLEMLKLENKRDSSGIQPSVDMKTTHNSSRSSSIISSESSSTLKSLSKTESSDNSDQKAVKSSAVKEEKMTKIVEKSKTRVSSSISLKTSSVKHQEESIVGKATTEVKYDRHGNIRISLDDQERQKRLRAERFGPIDDKQPKSISRDRKIDSRDRSFSPPSKKSKTSSRHHLSDPLPVEKSDRRKAESRHKRISGHHKYEAYVRSRSRERSHSSKIDTTRTKSDPDRSSRAGLEQKYRDFSREGRFPDRDTTSMTNKKSRKLSGNFSRDHSPAHSSRSKLSLERESSIGSDFSRRSKSERMSTQSIDALLMPSNIHKNSDVKNSDLNASDPIIEQMSPISADSTIPDVDSDSPNNQIKRKKSKSEECTSPKKDAMVADGESDGNFSDWSEGEDELLLKTDGFETMDEVCNISDSSLEKGLHSKRIDFGFSVLSICLSERTIDTWVHKSNPKKRVDKDDALEAISDDELENIIGESDPIDSTSESRNANSSRQMLDALDIDWKSLVSEPKAKSEFVKGSARKRFNPANVLMKIGFSQTLAGPELSRKLIDFCKEELKEEFVPFKHPIAAIHSFISDRIRERQQLFGSDTSQSTVLSGRKELQIRKILNKTNFKLFDNCLMRDGSSSSTTDTSGAHKGETTTSVNESLVSSTNPIETHVTDIECF